jgi:phage tail-like protein
MSQGNPTSGRKDPLTTFCFSLQIKALGIERAQAYFKSIKGLTSESEVIDYKEGGHNTGVRRLPGPAKWPNLVLQQGFTGPPWKLLDWRKKWMADNREKLKRLDGIIYALGPDMKPIWQCTFTRGWPIKWVGPEFDSAKNELAIETLEIAHEGLTFG